MPDFDALDDAGAAGWLADISGYLRAKIAIAQEYEALDGTRQDVPFVWLDRMVGTADQLAALDQWRFVADLASGSAGMRIIGTGDALDASLRSWMRGSEAPLQEELAPGALARRTESDLGSSVLVGPDRLSVTWFVSGDLPVEELPALSRATDVWRTIAAWAERHDTAVTELGRPPGASGATDHVRLRLAGSDRKDRLLDALELYGELGVDEPRRDVLTAFMNHDMGEIGLRVECGDVGVVEIGLTGDRAHLPALVLLLDDLGADTVEHVARLQGVMDSEPAFVAPVLGQFGQSVQLQYDLSAYHAVDSDD